MPTIEDLDSGSIAWMLAASALVLFMTPGLAFFYAGFVRSKNVLGTLMQSFITIGLVGIAWVVIGYSLAFGPISRAGASSATSTTSASRASGPSVTRRRARASRTSCSWRSSSCSPSSRLR